MRSNLIRTLAGFVALLLCTVVAVPAQAEPDPEFFENLATQEQHALVDFFYMGAALQPPWEEENAVEEAGLLLNSSYEEPGSESSEYEMERMGILAFRINLLRKESEMVPPNIASIVKNLGALGGAAIGTKVLLDGPGIDMIHEVGLPDDSLGGEEVKEGDFCYTVKNCNGGLRWYPKGQTVAQNVVIEEPLGAFLFSGRRNNEYWSIVRWWEPPCEFTGFTPPPVARMKVAIPSNGLCATPEGPKPVDVDYPYLIWDDLLGLRQPKPWDGISEYNYLVKPEAPTQAEAEEAIKNGVNGDELVQRWHDPAKRDEPEYFPPIPIVEGQVEENHGCDISPGPIYANPERNGEPFTKFLAEPFSITHRPEVGEGVPIYLRLGKAKWKPALGGWSGPRNIDAWNGWGYRHIAAKHGWHGGDYTETVKVLTDGEPEPQSGGKFRYEGIVSEGCNRVVIVDFVEGKDPETEEPDPAPRGIVTSYNEVVK